jgi:hypothetical protein
MEWYTILGICNNFLTQEEQNDHCNWNAVSTLPGLATYHDNQGTQYSQQHSLGVHNIIYECSLN